MNKEEKKNSLKQSLSKGAELFGKAKKAVVSAADQNNDGKLDFQDVSIMVSSLGTSAKKRVTDVVETAKESGETWNEKRNQQRLEAERSTLRPIFADDVEKSDFAMPRLIRVTDMERSMRRARYAAAPWGMSPSSRISRS